MAYQPFIHIYWIFRIWFGWVLWHINQFVLFNVPFYLFIYIKYIWFGLVWFYFISTIVGFFFNAKSSSFIPFNVMITATNGLFIKHLFIFIYQIYIYIYIIYLTILYSDQSETIRNMLQRILTCWPVWGEGIMSEAQLYIHFLCYCFRRSFILHTIQLNKNIF